MNIYGGGNGQLRKQGYPLLGRGGPDRDRALSQLAIQKNISQHKSRLLPSIKSPRDRSNNLMLARDRSLSQLSGNNRNLNMPDDTVSLNSALRVNKAGLRSNRPSVVHIKDNSMMGDNGNIINLGPSIIQESPTINNYEGLH